MKQLTKETHTESHVVSPGGHLVKLAPMRTDIRPPVPVAGRIKPGWRAATQEDLDRAYEAELERRRSENVDGEPTDNPREWPPLDHSETPS